MRAFLSTILFCLPFLLATDAKAQCEGGRCHHPRMAIMVPAPAVVVAPVVVAPRLPVSYDWRSYASNPGWQYCYRNGWKLVAAYESKSKNYYAVGPFGRWSAAMKALPLYFRECPCRESCDCDECDGVTCGADKPAKPRRHGFLYRLFHRRSKPSAAPEVKPAVKPEAKKPSKPAKPVKPEKAPKPKK